MNHLRVATVQFQHAPGDKEMNLSTIRRFVDEAAKSGVKLILFPECCISGYWHLRKLSRDELVAVAEPVFDGPSAQALVQLAAQYDMTVSAGLVEHGKDDRLYNTQVAAMPDGGVVKHRKLHCFISEHLSSGDAFTVFDTPYGRRMGVLTCYDNNLGENVRITALRGAEVLLAPHQTGGCDTGSVHAMGRVPREIWDARHAHPEAIEAEFRGPKGRQWLMTWLPARAHDNGLFLLFSNGVGVDDNEVRTGNAMILDCYGRVLSETWRAGDDMVIADLDFSLRERCTGARWIRSRRPELYGDLVDPTGKEESTRAVRFEHCGED